MFHREYGLIRFGDVEDGYTIPLNLIEVGGYRAYPQRRQDLTAERNAEGELIREVAANKPSSITLTLLPMTENELLGILNKLHEYFVIADQRKLLVTFFNPEYSSYRTENMYIPDFEMPIDYIEGDEVHYDSITLEFIGY